MEDLIISGAIHAPFTLLKFIFDIDQNLADSMLQITYQNLPASKVIRIKSDQEVIYSTLYSL